MENFFKTTIAKLGGITPKKEQEIVGNNDKAMKKIMNDSDLKKVYDHWEGKNDSQGNPMQEKFVNFIAKNSGEMPSYDKIKEDFRVATSIGNIG